MRALIAILAVVGCYTGSSTVVSPTRPTAPKPPRNVALADSLGFLPADSTLVVVLELRELRSSPTWKRLEPVIKQRIDSFTTSFARGCRFDPYASLRRAAMGLKNIDAAKPTGVIVIRGYQRSLVMSCLEKARAADPQTIAIDKDIVTIATTDSRLVLAFADDTTLVMAIGPDASPAGLTASIEAGAPLRFEPRFTEHLARLGADDPLWFVFDDPKTLANAAIGFGSLMMMGSGRIDDSGATGGLRFRLADAATASSTATNLQNQLGGLAMFFDELTVAADDTDLVVRMRMSAEKLDSALSMMFGNP